MKAFNHRVISIYLTSRTHSLTFAGKLDRISRENGYLIEQYQLRMPDSQVPKLDENVEEEDAMATDNVAAEVTNHHMVDKNESSVEGTSTITLPPSTSAVSDLLSQIHKLTLALHRRAYDTAVVDGYTDTAVENAVKANIEDDKANMGEDGSMPVKEQVAVPQEHCNDDKAPADIIVQVTEAMDVVSAEQKLKETVEPASSSAEPETTSESGTSNVNSGPEPEDNPVVVKAYPLTTLPTSNAEPSLPERRDSQDDKDAPTIDNVAPEPHAPSELSVIAGYEESVVIGADDETITPAIGAMLDINDDTSVEVPAIKNEGILYVECISMNVTQSHAYHRRHP